MNIICHMCVHAYFVELHKVVTDHRPSLQLRMGSNGTKIITYLTSIRAQRSNQKIKGHSINYWRVTTNNGGKGRI